MEHTEGTFSGAGGFDLYWQSWPAENPCRAVLAVIHGVGEHSGRYGNVVSRLVPEGYAVYGFDLRGHGRSPGQRGHIDSWGEYREDVKNFLSLISRKEPARPVFLWGHSMGALIALDYLLHERAGLRGAVISGAPLDPVGVAKPILVLIARVLSRVRPRFSMDLGLDLKALSRDLEVVKAYEADPLVQGKTTVRWGAEILRAIERVKAGAAEVRTPLFLIHGGEDRLNSPGGVRDFFEKVAFADKEMKIYPGSYHEVHNDLDHARVMTDVARWLERHVQKERANSPPSGSAGL